MNNILKNKNILLTRSENPFELEPDFSDESGPRLILFPTIKIKELHQDTEIFKNLGSLNSFAYIILTSVNAAYIFLNKIKRAGIEISEIKCQIAVTGQKTGDFCKNNGLDISIIPDKKYSAEGLIREFHKINIAGKNIIIPCSKLSGSELPDGLKKLDANVTVIHTYDITLPDKSEISEAKKLLKKYTPHVYMFTSPSTFRNFAKILSISNIEEYFRNKIVAAIGKTTQSEIEKCGVKVQIVPEIFTIKGMLKKTEDYFSSQST